MTNVDQQGDVDCAVIIVTYNSARDIDGLLDSLPAGAAGLRLRVIVVDNASTDGTVELVRARPEVQCVENTRNLGFAGGINVGRQHAGACAALAVLNPDLVLEAGALAEMYGALDDPAVGVVVPMLLNRDGSLYPSLRREPTLARAIGDGLLGEHFTRRPAWLSEAIRDRAEYTYAHAADWAGGAASMISATCDRAIGLWDERFFLYSEEVDYAARVRAAGFRIEYVPRARARHRGSGSGQSPQLCALMAVNRVRYIEKHGRHAGAYRAAVIMHELLRSADPSHRTALRVVSRRSAWAPLVSGLQAQAATNPVTAPSVKA